MSTNSLPLSLWNETLVDLTNFVASPLRTGIQRYFSQVLANWPDGHGLIPFCLTEDGKIALLNPDIVSAISNYIRAENQSLMQSHAEAILYYKENPLHIVSTMDLIAVRAILLPELTYLDAQLEFYRRCLSYFREKVVFIVYDFIPWLRPDFYPSPDFHCTDTYINLLQGVDHLAFISHKVKKEAESRVLRRALKDSLVLAGGADGLGGAGQQASYPTGIPEFVMVGTVERRKQQLTVLDVCEPLWEGGARFFLTFVGGAGDFLTRDERERLKKLQRDCPWFRWEKAALDSELSEIVRQATATIYASIEEGLGLPVMESLWLNVPVIANRTLPVLEYLPPGGIRLVDLDRPETLAQAIAAFIAPGVADQVKAEIDRATLPTWRGVAASLQDWIGRLPAPSLDGMVPARRRLAMTALISDLRLVSPKRLAYEAFSLVFGRPPTGAELDFCFERLGKSDGDIAATLERVSALAVANGAISVAERTAWLMSVEAAQALPADFSFTAPATSMAARVERGIALLRAVLQCPDDQFLPLAYQAALHRDPDPPGEADYRRFLSDHSHDVRWSRGYALTTLIGSDEGLACSGDPGFLPVIEDLLTIDVFSDAETRCFQHIIDGKPSRWLFARLLELRSEPFMRLARALMERKRVSDIARQELDREMTRAEKLGFLRDLCRDDEASAYLIRWIDTQRDG